MTDRLDVLINNAGIGSGEPRGPRRASVPTATSCVRGELPGGLPVDDGADPRMRSARAADGPARIVLVASLGQQAWTSAT